MEGWLKDLAPSNELRSWFGHNPARWEEFCRRYTVELEERSETWQTLLDLAVKQDITLLFSAHDSVYNNAVALKSFLEGKIRAGQ